MNFISPSDVRVTTYTEAQKNVFLSKNQRLFHLVFISFILVQLAFSIYQDFNTEVPSKLQFLRAFVRLIPNCLLITLFHIHSNVDYKKNPKKSDVLEFLLIFIALSYYLPSDYIFLSDILEEETLTRIETILPAFSLGIEPFWRFFLFYAIARKVVFVIIFILIMLCFYMILMFKYAGWFFGVKISLQILITWGVIFYAERIRISFFLENRKLKFQDKVYKGLLDALPESTIVLTKYGTIKYVNKYMSGMFGITNQRNFKTSLDNFSTLNFRDCIEDEMLKSLSSRPTATMKAYRQTAPRLSIYATHKTDTPLRKEPTIISPREINDVVNIAEVNRIKTAHELLEYLKTNVNKWKKTTNFVLIFDTKYKHPTGYVSSIELKAYVFHYDGQVDFTLIFQDTTYRDQIASLESANADYRNNVFATFSHELRTPLNANLGLLEYCMDCSEISEKVRRSVIEPALNSAKLLLSLVNDILDYSSFLNGTLELDIARGNLKKTLQNCVNLFRNKLQEKGIRLLLDIQELPDRIYTDHKRVSQIIVNLLGNALKFTTTGQICVQLKKDKEGIYKLSVIDTGIGMDEETQNRLRNNMEKGEFKEKINSNTAGMGIGLFISNMLAYNIFPTKNQGLLFESRKDIGTTFYFYIEDKKHDQNKLLFDEESPADHPSFLSLCSEMEDEEDDRITSMIKTHSLQFKMKKSNLEISEIIIKRSKVLIIDDEVLNITVLEAFCKSFGIRTERAYNGKEGIDKILKEGPNSSIRMVLTDVNMPIMDGYETAKRLKGLQNENKIPNVPIIGITAYVAKEKIQKCYKCGMIEVYNKPISKHTLYSILKKYGIV